MPVLNKFMCCCQLRTGAFVIGWVGLILEIVSLAGDSAYLANLGNIYIGIDVSVIKVALAISLACTVISLIAHIMLLWGANSKNRLFLLPWLIITMIIIVITFIIFFILGISLAGSSVESGGVVAVFIFGFLITGILLYVWFCILSLFQEFREKGEDGITLAPADYNSPPYAALQESC